MKKWIFLAFTLTFLLLIAACTCTAEQLVAPSNLSPYGTTVSIPHPDLAWQFDASCQVENFHFVVSNDARMGSPDLSGDTHNHYLGFATGIDYLDEDCTTYYWQVTAEAGGGSVTSPVANFRTDFSGSCPELPACTEAPAGPVAKLPWNDQEINSDHPQLVWEAGDADCETDNYHFQVAEQPDFTSLRMEGDTTGLEFSTNVPYLEDCHTYFWRVTSESIAGDTSSDIIQFWTDFEGTCPKTPMCSEEELAAPSLISPPDYSTVATPNPQLVYQLNTPDCGPEMSEVWVSEDPAFSTHSLHGSGDYASVEFPDSMVFGTPIDYLDDCTTYYWKVEVMVGDTTLSSPISVFGTDFSSSCPQMPMCTEGQLVEPVLISPIDGEVVNSADPPLVGLLGLPGCAPEAIEWFVDEEDTFSIPVIAGRANYVGVPIPAVPVFQGGYPYLEDCTTYFWKMRVSVGDTNLDSLVEDFRTDFDHECLALPDLGRDFADRYHFRSFNIGCSSPKAMFATFVFEEPIEGSYEAHIGNFIWPCNLLQGYDNALICSGSAVSQLMDVQVDLFSLDAQEIVLSQMGYSPACETPGPTPTNSCVPPANGCGQGMEWCNKTCECVQQGGCK
jgi:hypothetical protein